MKFGRLPRRFDPRVPHMRSFFFDKSQPPPPAAIDYTHGMPTDLGMLLNDTLGDCTCAAMCHAQQVWSFNATPPMVTVDDDDALLAYEGACGYTPSDPSTDQGGDEQTVLTYWLKTPVGANTLAAFVEVDIKNIDDVKRAIFEAGVCYIGINVPAFVQGGLQAPGSVWDAQPGADNSIVGGHAIVLAGYDAAGATFVSWGALYRMTWAFFAAFCEEAYALADREWIEQTGQSPGGLTLEALEAQMQSLKE